MPLNRTQAPPIQDFHTFPLPAVEKRTLPNGASLHALKHDAQPIIGLVITLEAGKQHGAPKALLLYPEMLLEGTAKLASAEIAEKIALLGAQVNIKQGYRFLEIELYGLKHNFVALLELVYECFTAASFPEGELQRLRKKEQQQLLISLEQTRTRVNREVKKYYFQDNEILKFSPSPSDYEALKRESLVSFHKKVLEKSSYAFFLVGDYDEEIYNTLAKLFGSRPHTSKKERSFTLKFQPNLRAMAMPMPDKAQTSLSLLQPCFAPDEEGYMAAKLGVHALGGYFGSRLMQLLREEHGLTYGVHAGLQPAPDGKTIFGIQTELKKGEAERSLQFIHEEIKKLSEEILPQAEFERVKNHFIGNYLKSLATPFGVMGRVRAAEQHPRMTTDFFDDYIPKIKAVQPEEIREFFKVRTPETWLSVWAG